MQTCGGRDAIIVSLHGNGENEFYHLTCVCVILCSVRKPTITHILPLLCSIRRCERLFVHLVSVLRHEETPVTPPVCLLITVDSVAMYVRHGQQGALG